MKKYCTCPVCGKRYTTTTYRDKSSVLLFPRLHYTRKVEDGIRIANNKTGKLYCSGSFRMIEKESQKCSICGGEMEEIDGPHGSLYPACKNNACSNYAIPKIEGVET